MDLNGLLVCPISRTFMMSPYHQEQLPFLQNRLLLSTRDVDGDGMSSIDSTKLVLELLAAVHMLHLCFGTWDTGAIIKLRQKHRLGYADTLQGAATGWSSGDLASESETEI
ncbi:hypothetical protein TNCV_4436711 [Trichonephila clavipes]|nr:hypothetical protein TNCV_4436711 [Trichonephila clavipes]